MLVIRFKGWSVNSTTRWVEQEVRHLVIPRLGEQLRPRHADDSPACSDPAGGAEGKRRSRGIHLRRAHAAE